MERKPVTIATEEDLMHDKDNSINRKESPEHEAEVKKRGGSQLLKAASFMFGRSKKPKPIHVAVEPKGMWKRLAGSMHPLRLHNNHPAQPHGLPSPTVEHLDDMVPSCGASSSSGSEESIGRYMSAVNLRDLDRGEDEDDEACNDQGGDEMIDFKAEVFIAQFYEQMRLQRMSAAERSYRERIQRSMG